MRDSKYDRTKLNKAQLSKIDLSTAVYGKVPPQAKELEEAVLGGVMLEKNVFDIVAEILRPECFYMDAHQRIFKAMQELQQKNSPIDLLTLVEHLKFKEELETIGGPYFLARLTNSVVSSANIEAHCRIVLQKFMARELIRIGSMAVNEGYEDSSDVFDSIGMVEKEMSVLTTGGHVKSYSDISSVVVSRLSRIAELRKQDRHVTGVHTGYAELDRVTHGWQPTDLIILAARPSVGKTAFALNLARNAATHFQYKVPVGFFSLEMSTGQLVDRIISADGELLLDHITNGQLANDEMVKLDEASNRISEMKIYIDDTAAVNVFQLRSKARRMKRKHKIGLIIVDYIQLMSGMEDRKTNNREQEISTISRQLKILAKELEIPIIALSQLSRKVEDRKGGKIPQLSDLRESGAIEQDADMVMFLYREEDSNEMGESNKGLTHLKIAKHRNGTLETIDFEARLWFQKFIPYEHTQGPAEKKTGSWKPVSDLFDKNSDLKF